MEGALRDLSMRWGADTTVKRIIGACGVAETLIRWVGALRPISASVERAWAAMPTPAMIRRLPLILLMGTLLQPLVILGW
jgi:hypothetical protein